MYVKFLSNFGEDLNLQITQMKPINDCTTYIQAHTSLVRNTVTLYALKFKPNRGLNLRFTETS